MQRVRIGLTGLALVFLLVLIGAVIRSASNDEPATANIGGQASLNESANSQKSEPSEPLAQLGVAPGNTDLPNTAAGASPAAKK